MRGRERKTKNIRNDHWGMSEYFFHFRGGKVCVCVGGGRGVHGLVRL